MTPGYHLASLDAKTGKPDPKFGKNGVVDLMEGLGYPLVPLAVDDDGPLIISERRRRAQGEAGRDVGSGQEDRRRRHHRHRPGARTDRAPARHRSSSATCSIVGNSSIHGYYPIRMHNLPRHDSRLRHPAPASSCGSSTWFRSPASSARRRGRTDRRSAPTGVGKDDAWAPYSADPDLGLVYIPVGMPLMDEYGGHRPGDNLFGTSLVALDVKTGERKWHFQLVHHDIWDYDTPMAPNLMDVTVERAASRKIVAQTTKQGWMYMFDRVTGEPIWPMPETPVLKSDVPGEKTSPTQPIPSKPAPYSQQGLVESDLIDYTPAIKDGRAEAGEAVPHGAVLHSRARCRRQGRERFRARGTRQARAAA